MPRETRKLLVFSRSFVSVSVFTLRHRQLVIFRRVRKLLLIGGPLLGHRHVASTNKDSWDLGQMTALKYRLLQYSCNGRGLSEKGYLKSFSMAHEYRTGPEGSRQH
jgi:hypothetical protein